MVVSGELNNGREAGGWLAGKGFMKKCQRKVKRWNRPWYGPHRAHNQLKWWLRDSRSLYSAPRSFIVTFNPVPSHQSTPWWTQTTRTDHQLAGKKQTTHDFFINLIMYWCVFVFVQKIELPVMGDKTAFCRASHICSWSTTNILRHVLL